MNEEFLYVCRLTNKWTHNTYVKVGYTSNIMQRVESLANANPNYTYSGWQLYQHKTKLIGYKHDEQRLHKNNRDKRAIYVNKSIMPNGFTECYEAGYRDELIKNLTKMGYHKVYDEAEYPKSKPTPMFVWE